MRDFITEELSKLDTIYGYKSQDGKGWIKCPFHKKNGHLEKTPSLIINLEESSRYPIGSFHCFACGESGSWNDQRKGYNIASCF